MGHVGLVMVTSGDRNARQIAGTKSQKSAGMLEARDARESLGGNTELVAEAFGEVTTAPANGGSMTVTYRDGRPRVGPSSAA